MKFSVVVIINALDRTYEVLTLRIIGYTSSDVNKKLLAENIVMMIIGILIGLIAGYAVTIEYLNILMEEVAGKLFYVEFYVDVLVLVEIIIWVIIAGILAQIPAFRHISKLQLAIEIKKATL